MTRIRIDEPPRGAARARRAGRGRLRRRDDSQQRRRRRSAASSPSSPTRRPQAGLRGDHPGLPEDRRRQGRRVLDLVRRIRRAEPRGRGRPAGRRRRVLARARHDQARRRRPRRQGLETQTSTRASSPNSVVAFIVRKGNPKNIKAWDDLVERDVEVVTPNPFTSGGAKWNIMAAYGSQIEQGKSEPRRTTS